MSPERLSPEQVTALQTIAAVAPDLVAMVEERKRYGWLFKGIRTIGGYLVAIVVGLTAIWTFARDAIKSIGHTP